MNRIEEIDSAKFLGVFLVILGHQPIGENSTDFIYSFHMPLFFFLSGITFRERENFSRFFRSKLQTLITPYLVFGGVTYVFWVLLARKFGDSPYDAVPFWRPLVGMLYGNGTDGWLIHNTPLWFLPCLFLTMLVMFFVSKLEKRKVVFFTVLWTVSVLGFVLSQTQFVRLPWSLNIVPQALLFCGLGYYMRTFSVRQINNLPLTWIALLGVVMITYFVSQANSRVDLNANEYGTYFLFIVAAFCGILSVGLLSKLISHKYLAHFGKHSLVIFLLHGVAVSLAKGILVFGIGLDLTLLDKNLIANVILSAVVACALLPVAVLVERYLPQALGRI